MNGVSWPSKIICFHLRQGITRNMSSFENAYYQNFLILISPAYLNMLHFTNINRIEIFSLKHCQWLKERFLSAHFLVSFCYLVSNFLLRGLFFIFHLPCLFKYTLLLVVLIVLKFLSWSIRHFSLVFLSSYFSFFLLKVYSLFFICPIYLNILYYL